MTTATIPAMTSSAVWGRLEEIGAGWQGLGAAVECGSWFGASACALARGLVHAGYDRPLYLFDAWQLNQSEVIKARAAGFEVRFNQDIEAICRANVQAVYPRVETHKGAIQKARWTPEPIEIFVLDAVKRDPAFSTVMAKFVRHCVPGAIIVMLDFHYWKHAPAHNREAFMAQLGWAQKWCSEMGNLEDMGGLPGTSAQFFRLLSPIYGEAA